MTLLEGFFSLIFYLNQTYTCWFRPLATVSIEDVKVVFVKKNYPETRGEIECQSEQQVTIKLFIFNIQARTEIKMEFCEFILLLSRYQISQLELPGFYQPAELELPWSSLA